MRGNVNSSGDPTALCQILYGYIDLVFKKLGIKIDSSYIKYATDDESTSYEDITTKLKELINNLHRLDQGKGDIFISDKEPLKVWRKKFYELNKCPYEELKTFLSQVLSMISKGKTEKVPVESMSTITKSKPAKEIPESGRTEDSRDKIHQNGAHPKFNTDWDYDGQKEQIQSYIDFR